MSHALDADNSSIPNERADAECDEGKNGEVTLRHTPPMKKTDGKKSGARVDSESGDDTSRRRKRRENDLSLPTSVS